MSFVSNSIENAALRCISITYPFWPLPSPSPVISLAASSSCCIAGGGSAAWAFVAGAGLGIPMVAVPPFAFSGDGDDDDDYDGIKDGDGAVLRSGQLAWAPSNERSVTRMCNVSFTPLPPLYPSPSLLQPQSLLVLSSVSWRENRRSR